MVQNFETALSAFKSLAADAGAARREELLEAAGEALWFLVVQREACGLTNTEAMLRIYDVPLAVRLRMGPAAPSQSSPGSRLLACLRRRRRYESRQRKRRSRRMEAPCRSKRSW